MDKKVRYTDRSREMEKMRIVVAERDNSLRKNLKEMLTQVGYLVVGEADDGMTALKVIRSLQPDIVLVAANLPVLSGFELAGIIEESKLSAVVLMADYGEKDLLCKDGEGWPIPVLVKPFDEVHLFSVLEYSYAAFAKLVSLDSEIHRLKTDLVTRKVVEKAKGILMRTQGLTEEAAFKKMQSQSMKKRTSMKKIAEAVITAYEVSK